MGEIKNFFNNSDISIAVIVKGNGKEALYDKNKQKRLVPFDKYSFSIYGSVEEETYEKSGGRILLANGRSESFLIIDNKIVGSIKKGEFNYFTLPKTDKFICVQKHDKGSREAIYDIRKKEIATPFFRSIYPSVDFPKIPYYKAKSEDGFAVYSFPSNERMTEYFLDVSSVDAGILGGKNNYYATISAMGNITIYKKWNEKIITVGETDFQKIFDRLSIPLNERIIIERVFYEL